MKCYSKRDMVWLNSRETEIFPANQYRLVIWGNEHNPPHLHVKSAEEGFQCTFTFDGKLYQVIRRGARNPRDTFSDITHKLLQWFPLPKKNSRFTGTNLEYVELMWEDNNPEL